VFSLTGGFPQQAELQIGKVLAEETGREGAELE